MEIVNNNYNRQDFLLETINQFNELEPSICLQISEADDFYFDGKYRDISDVISLISEKSGSYDYVMTYNTLLNEIRFSDEQPGRNIAQKMRKNFQSLDIEVYLSGEENNLIPLLLDKNTLKISRNGIADRAIIKMLIEASIDKKKRILLIIDNGERFLGNGNDNNSSNANANESIINEFNKYACETGSHILLIDRKNQLERQNISEIKFITIPQATRSELKKVLDDSVKLSPEDEIEILLLASGIGTKGLRTVIKKTNSNCDLIKRELIKFKEELMNNYAEGVLECTYKKLNESQISIPPEEMEYYLNLAKNIKKDPTKIPSGILLPGPPGVGKSTRAKFIASLLGVPFLELTDIGYDDQARAGSVLNKVKKFVNTVMRFKPCVIFIDEIDKVFPRSDGIRDGTGVSQEHAQAMGYLQKKFGEEEMKGALLFGACNDPGNINDALTRNGRFTTIIACLPPLTKKERINVFNAVWNQIDICKEKKLDEDILEAVVSLGEHVVGADYLALLEDACLSLDKFDGDMNLAVLNVIIQNKKLFEKSDKFFSDLDIAKSKHRAPFRLNEPDQENRESESNIFAIITDMRRKAEKEISEANKERQKLLDEKKRFDQEKEEYLQSIQKQIEKGLEKGYIQIEKQRSEIQIRINQLQIEKGLIEKNRQELEETIRIAIDEGIYLKTDELNKKEEILKSQLDKLRKQEEDIDKKLSVLKMMQNQLEEREEDIFLRERELQLKSDELISKSKSIISEMTAILRKSNEFELSEYLVRIVNEMLYQGTINSNNMFVGNKLEGSLLILNVSIHGEEKAINFDISDALCLLHGLTSGTKIIRSINEKEEIGTIIGVSKEIDGYAGLYLRIQGSNSVVKYDKNDGWEQANLFQINKKTLIDEIGESSYFFGKYHLEKCSEGYSVISYELIINYINNALHKIYANDYHEWRKMNNIMKMNIIFYAIKGLDDLIIGRDKHNFLAHLEGYNKEYHDKITHSIETNPIYRSLFITLLRNVLTMQHEGYKETFFHGVN